MKWNLMTIALFVFSTALAQNNKDEYPVPEFNNEIYFLNKENMTLVRLEKEDSRMRSRPGIGGFERSETSYSIAKEKSPVRIRESDSLSFILYTGGAETENTDKSGSKSRGSKIDPEALNGLNMMTDPSQKTFLYETYPGQGGRKVIIESESGMKILGKNKKESTKFSYSVHEIKPGYLELVVDKHLPKGEYVFVVMGGFSFSMDGSATLFAFGID